MGVGGSGGVGGMGEWGACEWRGVGGRGECDRPQKIPIF